MKRILSLSRPAILATIFGIVGFVATAIVFLTGYKLIKVHETHVPLLKVYQQLKERSGQAQLSLGKILDGNSSSDLNQVVLMPLTSCYSVLDGIYRGTRTEFGILPKPETEATKLLLKEALISTEKYTEAVKSLHEAYSQFNTDTVLQPNQEVASKVEEADLLFKAMQAKMDATFNQMNSEAELQFVNSKRSTWLGIALIFVLFAVLTIGFYRLQMRASEVLKENEKRLEDESKRVTKLSTFIEAVSAGNYNIELAADDSDNLTDTLVAMRDKLRKNAEDDKRRNWSTTGLAQIGEILRSDATSSNDLYDTIIKFIVKYTKSNQGGLFVINDENEGEKHLDLLSCYAFERKKYLQKRVSIGDGLVGQCYLEAEKIYVTEVPKEYISITSGLGGSSPSSVLVIPMKVNDQIYGVIELASFNKYADYEIELIEKFAESVAATISNVRINDKTKVLLATTKQQAEEMRAQEEEIRQNMEELEATQEEMRRKQVALETKLQQSELDAEALQVKEKTLIQSQQTLQAIVDNIPRSIFWKNQDLQFMGCNTMFAQIAGFKTPAEIVGKTDFDMPWREQADAYRKDDLQVMNSRRGKLDIEEVNVSANGEESWVRTSKVPVIDKDNKVIAILGMFEDITSHKLREADIAQKLREREDALQELAALKDLIGSKK